MPGNRRFARNGSTSDRVEGMEFSVPRSRIYDILTI